MCTHAVMHIFTEQKQIITERVEMLFNQNKKVKERRMFVSQNTTILCVLTLLLGLRHVSALTLGHPQVTRYVKRRNYTV